jgi:hypothetical protein
MRVPGRFFAIPLAIASASLAFAIPLTTFAGGTTNAATGAATVPATAAAGAPAAAPRPRPDEPKKIWTNDDVIALGAPYRETSAPQTNQSTSNQVPVIQVVTVPALAPVAPSAPLNPEQDPRWYGDQLASLEAQLASIDSEEERLREFRATDAGLPTGLVLDAPCEGITTDNLIAQLDEGRQVILDQIDELSDTARANDLPPGILVEGRGRVETEAQLTGDEEKAALTNQFQESSNELAQTQEEVADMQAQAAAQGITLTQPVPGEGGNMTTDLVQRLDDRAGALENQINTVEGDALSAGVEPGELR